MTTIDPIQWFADRVGKRLRMTRRFMGNPSREQPRSEDRDEALSFTLEKAPRSLNSGSWHVIIPGDSIICYDPGDVFTLEGATLVIQVTTPSGNVFRDTYEEVSAPQETS